MGWKLFARKGNRNVAVAAVARKLLVPVWHMLSGNPPTALETDKSFTLKLYKLAVSLGSSLRSKLQLATLCSKASKSFGAELFNPSRNERSKTNRFAGGYAPPNPAPLAAAGVRGEPPATTARREPRPPLIAVSEILFGIGSKGLRF